MGPSKKIWLNVSIFYNRNRWTSIFKEAIIPSLTALANKNLAQAYISGFNAEQGDNIRLSILLNESTKEYALNNFHHLMTNYLRHHPSEGTDQVYPLTEFLMPFPVNSLRFNLFDGPGSAEDEATEFKIAYSPFITDTFAKNEIDDAAVFSFMLYSTFALIKFATEIAASFKLARLLAILRPRPEGASYNGNDYLEPYNILFNENKELIFEIYHEVWQKEKNGENSGINVPGLKECFKMFLGNLANVHEVETTVLSLSRHMLYQLNMKQELLEGIFYMVDKCLAHKEEFF